MVRETVKFEHVQLWSQRDSLLQPLAYTILLLKQHFKLSGFPPWRDVLCWGQNLMLIVSLKPRITHLFCREENVESDADFNRCLRFLCEKQNACRELCCLQSNLQLCRRRARPSTSVGSGSLGQLVQGASLVLYKSVAETRQSVRCAHAVGPCMRHACTFRSNEVSPRMRED